MKFFCDDKKIFLGESENICDDKKFIPDRIWKATQIKKHPLGCLFFNYLLISFLYSEIELTKNLLSLINSEEEFLFLKAEIGKSRSAFDFYQRIMKGGHA